MFKEICLANLANLSDGTAGAIIDRELRKAIADLEDRGLEDGKPRLVKIQVEMAMDGKENVVVRVQAQAVMPALRTPVTRTSIRHRGKEVQLVFQDLNPDSPDQASFDDVPPGGEK